MKLALGAGLVLGVCALVLLVLNDGDEGYGTLASTRDPSEAKKNPVARSTITASREEAPGTAPAEPVRFAWAFVVRDSVSGRPLPGFTVTLADDAGNSLQATTTTAEGTASFEGDREGEVAVVSIAGPPSLGEVFKERMIRDLEFANGTARVDIAVYARLIVAITADDTGPLSGEMSGEIRVLPYPEVPDDPSLDVADIRILKHDPEQYARYLGRKDLIRDFAVTKPFEREGILEVFVPHDGDVAVVLADSNLRAQPTIVGLTRGSTASASLLVGARPVIGGVVVDQSGDALVDQKVSVACKMALEPDMFYATGRHASAMSLAPGGALVQVLSRLSAVTDSEGRFGVPMPHSGEVAAWAVPLGYTLGFDSIELEGPYESTRALRVVVTKVEEPEDHTMRVTLDGNPVPELRFTPVQKRPRDHFHVQYRDVVSDANGFVDVSQLREGVTYRPFIRNRPDLDWTDFVCRRGGEIKLQRRAKQR